MPHACSLFLPKHLINYKFNVTLNIRHHYLSLFSYFSVVNQSYKVTANILNAARGCTAVLQCSIPLFIKDFVKVVSWVQEPSFYIYPSLQGGMFICI